MVLGLALILPLPPFRTVACGTLMSLYFCSFKAFLLVLCSSLDAVDGLLNLLPLFNCWVCNLVLDDGLEDTRDDNFFWSTRNFCALISSATSLNAWFKSSSSKSFSYPNCFANLAKSAFISDAMWRCLSLGVIPGIASCVATIGCVELVRNLCGG